MDSIVSHLRMSLLSSSWPQLTRAAMFFFVYVICLLILLPGDVTSLSLSLSPTLSLSPSPFLPPSPSFVHLPHSIYSWNWWFNEELVHHQWPLPSSASCGWVDGWVCSYVGVFMFSQIWSCTLQNFANFCTRAAQYIYIFFYCHRNISWRDKHCERRSEIFFISRNLNFKL